MLVLSKAIELLNSDLIFAKNHRSTSSSNIVANTSPNNSASNTMSSSPNTSSILSSTNNKVPIVSAAEFEQLKKMKGNCHRRLA